MSVYTTAQPQLGQQAQQPYGFGQFGQQPAWQQSPYGPQAFQGQQLPQGQMFGQQQFGQPFGMQQPYGMAQMGVERMLPQLVTQLALNCAATAVNAVVEQLRIAPEALIGMQTQGQIPPHVYSSVLTECARRVAPVLHTTIAPILQGQFGQLSQTPGQGLGQQFGQQQPWATQSPMGMSQLSGAGFPGGFGI
jgi:hypothetical protein